MRRMSPGLPLVALAPLLAGAQESRRSLRPAIGVHAGYASIDKAGSTLGFGASADDGRWGSSAELRRVQAQNVSLSSRRIGLRYRP